MYLRQQRQSAGNRSPESTIDVMVCIVDHFEPGEQRGDTVAGERVRDWCQRYADMVFLASRFGWSVTTTYVVLPF